MIIEILRSLRVRFCVTVYSNGPEITTNKGNSTKTENSTQAIEKSQEGSAFIIQEIFDPEEISARVESL